MLIQFTASPGSMTSVPLSLERNNLTIDGTDANGNPWIVGDPAAAAAGTQDPFPRAMELSPNGSVWVKADNVTLKGLEIGHDNGFGSVSQNHLVNQFAPYAGTRFDAVRLDAHNTVNCNLNPEDCELLANLLNLQPRTSAPAGPTATLFNVEAAAGFQGLEATANHDLHVEKSWVRNNYFDNIRADGAVVHLEHSVVERAGLRPPDDLGMSLTSTARGVHLTDTGSAGTRLETDASIIRNNRSYGIEATGFADLRPENDAYCGNGAAGLRTAADAGGDIPSLTSFGGLAAVYNNGNGVRVAQDDFVVASLNNDSAFASNAQCGLFNEWLDDPVSAINNQWRALPSEIPVDTCKNDPNAGPVAIEPRQNQDTAPIVISSTFPSNALIKGQTIQVLGSGFNAITGNPLAGDGGCTVGVSTNGSGQGQSCCNKTTRANGCAALHDANPGGGNCVELRSGTGTWVTLPVKAVTPRMIEAQVAGSNVFLCLGASNELVQVTKKSSVGLQISNQFAHCTNVNQL